jgi:hypothetical protein
MMLFVAVLSAVANQHLIDILSKQTVLDVSVQGAIIYGGKRRWTLWKKRALRPTRQTRNEYTAGIGGNVVCNFVNLFKL